MNDRQPSHRQPPDGQPPGGRHLWLDPSFGASGDMMLGVLVGLGAPLPELSRRLESLGLPGWSLHRSTVTRCSLTATRVEVVIGDGHGDHGHGGQGHGDHRHGGHDTHHHRAWSSIDRLLAGCDLERSVVTGARATFRRLAEVEAGIHGIDIDQVRFHEVGALDAIIDIVGSWIALDLLELTSVSAGPVGVGSGTVTAAHGRLPLPAPATAELLVGAPVRSVAGDTGDTADTGEAVTPTGAALLSVMADRWQPMPDGVLRRAARGAGGRDPEGHPNVLSGYLLTTVGAADVGSIGESEVGGGSTADEADAGAGGWAATVAADLIQTNLDDVTGELVAHVIDRCLRAGADDAWARTIVMKKGRPGVELQVLCRPEHTESLRRLVLSETGSLGARTIGVTKHELRRHVAAVVVDGLAVSIKIGPHGAKPEFADVVAAADALGLPAREISRRALESFHQAETPYD